jgi:probable phosphoglycerate mutase
LVPVHVRGGAGAAESAPGSPELVGERAGHAAVAAVGTEAEAVLVAHGHFLRVLTPRRFGLPPSGGVLFQRATGTPCRLSTEHGRPVIAEWNVRPAS